MGRPAGVCAPGSRPLLVRARWGPGAPRPAVATETGRAGLPLFPPRVAVMGAAPTTSPLTSPPVETVATAALLVAHVTTRPVSRVPPASFGVAVSWTVCPGATLADAGLTVTVATGATVTVTLAIPLFPSLVAVTVADPAAFAVTNPLALTVATVVLLLAHVIVRPVSTLPAESFVVTDSCAVWPTTRPFEAGLTVTEATATAFTVTAAVPLFPSLVAVIVS